MKICIQKQTGMLYLMLFALLAVCIIPASAGVQPASGGNTLTVSGVILPPSAPVAGFIGTPISGSVPLKVTFTDQSIGAITEYAWDFDNNGVIDSTAKSPSYIFTKAGTYTVKLNVTGPGGYDEEIKTDYIMVTTVVLPPVARFTQDTFFGRNPLTVNFTDHSLNNPTSYFWRFGDGSTSTEKNPTYRYTRPGIYVISEQVINEKGRDTAYSAVFVPKDRWWSDTLPEAKFIASPKSGTAPLKVVFTDLSTNIPTSWKWAYRNATIGWTQFATTNNPSYTFTSAGTYDIKLNATNDAGSDEEIKTGYITVIAPVLSPVANFKALPQSGTAPLTVVFTDLSTNTPTSWKWAYRNATIGWTQFAITNNPSYTFTSAGTYDIKLTAFNADGSNDEIKTKYITVTAPVLSPVANFKVSPQSGNAPLKVTFTDLSTNTPTSWKWAYRNATVGWTQFATTKNPSFTFQSAGMYDIKLNASNAAGSDEEIKTKYITVTTPVLSPDANFKASPQSGNAPLKVMFTDLSTNTPTSWKWAYRNATIGWTQFATTKNPSFTFQSAGMYDIKITATNDAGSDDHIKTRYITVTAPVPSPVANFRALPQSGTTPLAVAFTDQSSGVITAYAWDFDNNGVIDSTLKNPSHTFTKSGTYTVKLKVTGPGGTDDETKTNCIEVTKPTSSPVARFTQDKFYGEPPLTVHFTDGSLNSPVSYFWKFGDGSTSTEKSPTHKYTRSGIYIISEQVTNEAGSDTKSSPVFVLVKAWW